MKLLSIAQLKQNLKKSLSACYLISSDEIILKQDATDAIISAAKQHGVDEINSLSFSRETKDDELYTLLYTNSMFAKKRLIYLKFDDGLPAKSTQNLFKEYSQQPIVDTYLLLQLRKIDTKTQQSSWYQALDHIGLSLTLWPISIDQLPHWIAERAQFYQLNLPLTLAKQIAEYVEGNLISAAQVIEKLSLYQPQGIIDLSCIQQIIFDESRYTIFNLAEQLFNSKPDITLNILNHLQQDHTEPALILWAITRELRHLIALSQAYKKGENLIPLFKKYAIFSNRQAAVKKILLQFTPDMGKHLLQRAAHLDLIIKGWGNDSIWQAFEIFCLDASLILKKTQSINKTG